MAEFHFITKEPIHKGWSKDKKYCVTDANGIRYLLRISDMAQYDAKQFEFHRMKQVAALGVPMCFPIEFGACGEGVYSIQSWIDGVDAQEVIPSSMCTVWKPAESCAKSTPYRPPTPERTGKFGSIGRWTIK